MSDISLAGEDGYALIRHVRNTVAPEQRVFAIALTAHAQEDDRASALAAGFDVYVAKPADVSDLVTLIARAAGRS